MALANLKVIRVVSRRNLHAACPEFLVDMLVHDNRYGPAGQRKLQHLSDQIAVALVVFGDSYGRIAQHRLRTGRRDLDKTAFLADDRVADMPEKSVLIFMLDLSVRQRSLAFRAPVDNPASLIDPAFLVELAEYGFNSPAAALVHGKALPLPVRGGTELLQLADDPASVLFFPLPAVFQEFLPADLMLVDALVLEHVCDPDLCRDRGVVRTRLPERFIALHPLPADQNILQGVVQGVAHMKLPGYIRRRHHDCERLSVGIHLRMEIASVEPVLIDPVLHAGRIVCLDKFSLTHSLLSPVRCPFRKALHLSAGSCTAVRSSALSG